MGHQSLQGAHSPVHLEATGITRRFGQNLALDHVDFRVAAGEVHALVGENGAGKTTLMNVIYGLVRPDRGEIRVDGRPVSLRSPAHALRLGIGMVHQHFMLVPDFTVEENLRLGQTGFLFSRRQVRQLEELIEATGLGIDARAIAGRLSVGEQQRVEIAKALVRGARLLILDEPTGVLAPPEVDDLFQVLRRLRATGSSIVFITHKLREALAISDHVTVLRRGRVVLAAERVAVTADSLASAMIGDDGASVLADRGAGMSAASTTDAKPIAATEQLDPKARPCDDNPVSSHPLTDDHPPTHPHTHTPALRLIDLHVRGDRGHEAVRGVSLEVHAGEILGVAGVEGNGQTELAEAIAGLRPVERGRIVLGGQDVTEKGVRGRMGGRLAYIPGDRQRTALILLFRLWENVILHSHSRPPLRRGPWIDSAAARRQAMSLVKQYDIRTSGVAQTAAALSGGNQQKLVVARELSRRPQLLLAVNPTRGIDFASAAQIHDRVRDHRAGGGSVLLFSTELEEVCGLADRVAVMFGGTIASILRPDAGALEFGRLMTGAGTP